MKKKKRILNNNLLQIKQSEEYNYNRKIAKSIYNHLQKARLTKIYRNKIVYKTNNIQNNKIKQLNEANYISNFRNTKSFHTSFFNPFIESFNHYNTKNILLNKTEFLKKDQINKINKIYRINKTNSECDSESKYQNKSCDIDNTLMENFKKKEFFTNKSKFSSNFNSTKLDDSYIRSINYIKINEKLKKSSIPILNFRVRDFCYQNIKSHRKNYKLSEIKLDQNTTSNSFWKANKSNEENSKNSENSENYEGFHMIGKYIALSKRSQFF